MRQGRIALIAVVAASGAILAPLGGAGVAVTALQESLPAVGLPPFNARATFEAASVKANLSGDSRMGARISGRTYTATNMPLRPVIATAYGIPGPQSYRLRGGPSWIGPDSPPFVGGDRFDIEATLPDGATPADLPAMLRGFLAERFKLVVHTEMQEAPMYALVLARNDGRLGSRLRRAAIDCEAMRAKGELIPEPKPGERPACDAEIGGAILGRGQRLTTLARYLTPFVGRPVVDRTGLTDAFDFDLEFPELNAGPGQAGPSTDAGGGPVTALQEQLGLKLEPMRGSLEYVVIDRIEKPTEN